MDRFVVLVSLAACSSKTAAPPSTTGSGYATTGSGSATTVVTPADAAIACMTPDTPDNVAVTPTAVDFCVGDAAARTCWHADLATKHVEPRPVVEAAPAADPPPGNATRNPDGSVKLCLKPGSCSTVKPPFKVYENEVLRANADGSVLLHAGDGGALEIYDVATRKLRAKIAPWATEMGPASTLSDATFAGPNVIAWSNSTPVSCEGRIFTYDGRLVGHVSPKDFSQNPSDSWQTPSPGGTTWLFKQIDGPQLLAVDVATATLVKTYDLTPLAVNTTDDTMNAAGLASTDQTIVYLSGKGIIGVIARATGAIAVISPPRCTTP